MLRGVTSSHAAAQPPRFFDITNCRNSGFAQTASGEMIVATGQSARDQANVGFGGQKNLEFEYEIEVRSVRAKSRSRTADLHAAVEEVTEHISPRLNYRGPIEARSARGYARRGQKISAVELPRPH